MKRGMLVTALVVLTSPLALLSAGGKGSVSGAYVEARKPTERGLAEIWRQALAMDQVSITDSFEEIGGDCLLAVSIFADIERVFSVPVPIGLLSRAPTIQQLASNIDELLARR